MSSTTIHQASPCHLPRATSAQARPTPARPDPHGGRDEEGGRSRARSLARGAHAEEALLGLALLADRGHDRGPAQGRLSLSAPSRSGAFPSKRPIRSFVLRQGRITAAQTRAIEALYPKYGVEFADAPFDANAVFGRSAPLIVEIGSGMGETTVRIARAHPENDYLAIEVHLPGVGALLKLIEAGRFSNLRVLRHDAIEVLERMIADGSLAGVHLFFPDPWPKNRHHKRRIVQPAFVALVAQKLAVGGVLHAATDWAEYGEWMAAIFDAEPKLEALPAGRGDRPPTKFEERGMTLGHAVRDLRFRKIP